LGDVTVLTLAKNAKIVLEGCPLYPRKSGTAMSGRWPCGISRMALFAFRFTPESGHVRCKEKCRFGAIADIMQLLDIISTLFLESLRAVGLGRGGRDDH
jgi:hypothetical protein